MTYLSLDEIRKLKRRWQGMRERCSDEKHKSFEYYGGRGIAVTPEWGDWRAFFDWCIESGFQPELKLERVNNDLGYSPENCKWATHRENCNNQSRTVRDEDGTAVTLAIHNKGSAVSRKTVYRRVKAGIPLDKAMSDKAYSTPGLVGSRKSKRKAKPAMRAKTAGRVRASSHDTTKKQSPSATLISAFGDKKTISEWASDSRCVIGESALGQRLRKHGWDAESAITTPKRGKRT